MHTWIINHIKEERLSCVQSTEISTNLLLLFIQWRNFYLNVMCICICLLINIMALFIMLFKISLINARSTSKRAYTKVRAQQFDRQWTWLKTVLSQKWCIRTINRSSPYCNTMVRYPKVGFFTPISDYQTLDNALMSSLCLGLDSIG